MIFNSCRFNADPITAARIINLPSDKSCTFLQHAQGSSDDSSLRILFASSESQPMAVILFRENYCRTGATMPCPGTETGFNRVDFWQRRALCLTSWLGSINYLFRNSRKYRWLLEKPLLLLCWLRIHRQFARKCDRDNTTR